MFNIKYKIFNSLIENDDVLKGEYGYFLFEVENNSYGEYREDIDLEILSMDIYDWFASFVQAIKVLKQTNKVYISDVETPEVWIKLVSQGLEAIQISEIFAEKPDGIHSVEIDLDLNEKETIWTESVKLEQFEKEVISETKNYLSDLKSLNGVGNRQIRELEVRLNEISLADDDKNT